MPCLAGNNSGSSGLSFNPRALYLLCSARKNSRSQLWQSVSRRFRNRGMDVISYNDKLIYGTRDDVSLLLLQTDFR